MVTYTDQGRVRGMLQSGVNDYDLFTGRNAESFVLVYDSPSFEVLRPTPYFDYVAMNEGVTMREYGFRCVYK